MQKHIIEIRQDQPAEYRIEILGRLDPEWATSLGNLDYQVKHRGENIPVTILSGEVIDQAALHGLLQQIRDLGVILLHVEYLSPIESNYNQGPGTETDVS